MVSHERRILSNWLRDSKRLRITTTNDRSTLAVTEMSIIMFASSLARDNNISTDNGCTTIFANTTPTTLVTTERTQLQDSHKLLREDRKRRYTETKVEDEPIVQANERTQPTKRQRLIPLSQVLTTTYQYGRVIKRKRKGLNPKIIS